MPTSVDHIRRLGISVWLVGLLTDCGSEPSEVSKAEFERRREQEIVQAIAPDWRKRRARDIQAELRTCVSDLRPRDASRRALSDVIKGEWRFLSYRHYEFSVFDEIEGVSDCDPSLPVGHDRLEQLSTCGEVIGPDHALNCACQKAELRYRAAYNQVILQQVARARARNCVLKRP